MSVERVPKNSIRLSLPDCELIGRSAIARVALGYSMVETTIYIYIYTHSYVRVDQELTSLELHRPNTRKAQAASTKPRAAPGIRKQRTRSAQTQSAAGSKQGATSSGGPATDNAQRADASGSGQRAGSNVQEATGRGQREPGTQPAQTRWRITNSFAHP